MRPLAASDPREVGRYRVLAELGRGGMGRVLLGWGPDGRLVAVKQVHAQFGEDRQFRARFRREVTASRKVSGAYTAAVVDADPNADTPWLASVFVPAPTLLEAVDAAGPLPQEPALRLAAGLATALAEVHRAGLVHRDLKPSNVLLAEDGPRVIDFGIARASEPMNTTELTQIGWLVGSPGFMSPEQAEGHALTPASDMFSLGCVLAMACTGKGPFDGTSVPQALYNVVHTEPDLATIPDGVRPIIERCLAKDPAARPTPAQLLDTIGHIAPSARPWPRPVHKLIAKRQAAVARLLHAPPEHATSPRPDPATLARTRLQLGLDLDDEPGGGVSSWMPRLGPLGPRIRARLARMRDTVVVLVGVLGGILAATDFDGGNVIHLSSTKFGADSDGARPAFLLDHASAVGGLAGVGLGGIVGVLAFVVGGRRTTTVSTRILLVLSVTGFVLGWFADRGDLRITAVVTGTGGDDVGGTVGGILGLVPVVLATILSANGGNKATAITLWVLAIPTAIVGASCGLSDIIGLVISDTIRVDLATVAGAAIGGGAAFRIVTAIHARNARRQYRRWGR